MQPLEDTAAQSADEHAVSPVAGIPPTTPAESGGPTGPEPTRYGDWERRGRCIDF